MNTNPAAGEPATGELGPAHQLVRLEYGYPACRCGYTIEPEPFATYDAAAGLRDVLKHIARNGSGTTKPLPTTGPTEWDLSGTWNHALKPDHNGDPVCKCGWDPSNPRTTGELVPATQLQAAARVRAHLDRVGITLYAGATPYEADTAERHRALLLLGAAPVSNEELRANLAAAGILPHPNPAPHLTAQQRLDDARAALHAAALEYAAALDALNTITEPK